MSLQLSPGPGLLSVTGIQGLTDHLVYLGWRLSLSSHQELPWSLDIRLHADSVGGFGSTSSTSGCIPLERLCDWNLGALGTDCHHWHLADLVEFGVGLHTDNLAWNLSSCVGLD